MIYEIVRNYTGEDGIIDWVSIEAHFESMLRNTWVPITDSDTISIYKEYFGVNSIFIETDTENIFVPIKEYIEFEAYLLRYEGSEDLG